MTWNSAATIDDLLDSVPGSCSAPHDVFVVDNASSDDTVARAQRHPTAPTVIANTANRGLAAANNQGLLASAAPFALVCNPDVVIDGGAVDALAAVMHRRPRAAFVVPRLYDGAGAPHVTVGSLPSFGAAFTNGRLGRGEPFWWSEWAHDEERAVPRAAEACYLVRRAALGEIGAQDERFWLDWEGIDWAARVADAGWEIWYTPMARATHIGGVSIRQAKLRSVVGSHWGMYRYFAKRRGAGVRPLLAAAVLVRAAVKLAIVGAGVDLYTRARQRSAQSDSSTSSS